MPDSLDPATAPRRRSSITTAPDKPRSPFPWIAAFRWLALAWLFIGIPIAQIIRPAYNDFSQFYYASIVVRERAWNALYATPASDEVSPGTAENAIMKPAQKALLDRLFRRSQVNFWFIQPPTAALLLWPLSLFNPIPAHWVWLFPVLGCIWIVGRQAERIAEMCLGYSAPMIKLIAPLLAMTPLTYHTIRVGNISPIIAALLGWAAIEMYRDRTLAGLPMALGAVLKYATLPLGMVALFTGRWLTVLASVAVTIAIVAATFAIAGREVFHEFITVIVPSLKYCPAGEENMALQAFVARLTRGGLPSAVAKVSPEMLIALRGIQIICAAMIAWLIFRARRTMKNSPVPFFAACAAWTAWMLLFSPVFWDHYLPYLFPFFGWAIWEARQSRARLWIVIAIIAMAVVPTPFSVFKFPEPINSHQMFAVILMLGLSIARLRLRPDIGIHHHGEPSSAITSRPRI